MTLRLGPGPHRILVELVGAGRGCELEWEEPERLHEDRADLAERLPRRVLATHGVPVLAQDAQVVVGLRVALSTMNAGLAKPDDHLRVLREYGDAVSG